MILVLLLLMEKKTLLISGLSIFFIKGTPVLCNGLKVPPTNPPLLIVLFYAIEFLIISYWLRNNSVEFYEALKLVY